ncbi:hypothetical protein LCI18_003522 [Fusarium solani-melongenae]|uniref:Uncharacterized protein n=1 Tax=Fusarium solani subsp. cucurbitae TaxID=2747967 RepID=A0ACD3YUL7_FUSSC|nr:hypothetical protein LCI18_003522 [Fusarium solani-melongenae]
MRDSSAVDCSPNPGFNAPDYQNNVWVGRYDPNDLHVGDKVYVRNSEGTLFGPYYIATRPSPAKCTLSSMNGQSVGNGEEIDIKYVQLVDRPEEATIRFYQS